MSSESGPDYLKSIIQGRRTEKVLCAAEDASPVSESVFAKNKPLVMDALETAGWAPFHFPRNIDSIAEPWRAYVLWQEDTQWLAQFLKNELGVTTKEPLLCAGCHALVVVTWVPEQSPPDMLEQSEKARETFRVRNEEHLAASSAMVQNFLLMLTAHKMTNYWSSGGILRTPELLKKIGATEHERFLAGIFIEYPESHDTAKIRKPGALRNTRSNRWIQETKLAN